MKIEFGNIGPLCLALIIALSAIVIMTLFGCILGAVLGHREGRGNSKSYMYLLTKIFALNGLMVAAIVFILIGRNSNWFKCSYNCAYCKNSTNTVYEIKAPEHKYVCEICMTDMISKGAPPTKCGICAEYKSDISLENHKAICSDCKTKE